MKYNPPPGWPRPPQGWSPPPGWQPDPSWPAPPPGWQLWIADEPTRIMPAPRPYRTRPTRLPWYRKTGWIVTLLIFFFPLGLALAWMRDDWSLRTRWLITGAVGILLLIGIVAPKAPTQNVANSGTSTTLTTPTATASSASSPSAATSAPAAPTSAPAATSAAAAAPPATTEAAPTTQAAAPPPALPVTPAAPAGPDLCGAPANPFGYTLCPGGSYIYSPASGVCGYFNCIESFSKGHGYMEECSDGTYSMSGGIEGACSDHGGEDQPVYSG